MEETSQLTPRQRARALTLTEAKAIALRQLAEGGVEAISLKAIAGELGLTGPAIYRYFPSRNALLTELIADAYDELAAALDATPRAQVGALAEAYRGWALANPHRYRLLFSAPVPGFEANAARLAGAADRSMAAFVAAYAGAGPAGGAPLTRRLAAQLRRWAQRRGRDTADPDLLYRALITWTRLHGVVALEIEGAFASIGVDPVAVFRREVDVLTVAGEPQPPPLH